MRLPLPTPIDESGIFAVIRKPALDPRDVAHALIRGGIRAVEVTLDTPGALDAIRSLVGTRPSHTMVGAGTVTTVGECEAAIAAGAEFVVTPIADLPVIAHCVNAGVPVFPGALTPTEIASAWSVGATGIKVFPVGLLGPAYVSACLGPLSEVPLFAVGGVGAENAAAFIAAGAVGVGVGTWLTGGMAVGTIESRARSLVEVVFAAKL